MSILWIAACTQLALYGSCPQQSVQLINSIIVYLDSSSKFCPTLLVTVVLGYFTALLYAIKFQDGVADQRRKDDALPPGKHIMFARGSWRN
jgi:hypothetical protein